MEKILFDDLSFVFDKQLILRHVNATFKAGEIHLLTGISGSGKSTLLKLIAGLLPKYGGEITTGTVSVSTAGQIGMLFQDPAMQFALDTPRHELEFTLENCQVPTAKINSRVISALRFGKVEALANQSISTLSGGQQQRVALSVVMAMRPSILLLDEPFANVDEENRQLLLAQLLKINHDYRTTIIITDHDFHGYQRLNPFVWQLRDGKLIKLLNNQKHGLLQDDRQYIKASLPPVKASPIISAANLSIKRGNKTLLTPATFSLIKNKTTLLTGPNGIGKSTLLKAIAKLVKYQGTITFDSQNIQKISPGKYYQRLGLIFQHANDQFLNVTVGEELNLSLKNGQNSYFTSQQVQRSLSELGLAGREEQVIYSLSGGQKKKLQILLMLMMGQEVLLFDEPFTGLDKESLKKVLNLITASREKYPQTLLIVSHQLNGLDGFIDYHLEFNHQQLKYCGGNS
ncbi:ABC transporter ATP-binding protein [Limosilactobacillus sp. STM2_1]|uniref:ABC transporter ATP-binding protein n=1 Tax=Limosilactobacillus rudii TaxID=2759755 RepID=A0A7W3UL23_9LACO|nr:ABC transporter ATP-binding protein [Limosilactobacillus rudii]MBB1079496.1 ABC transporter ATP-binding protein [Limosilactobacillus rudii]MBB1097542.1 ABC transporter ATP-binding protein [Limosilactobacillus rudii]MCD7134652.1 energy-coupling factor ABC transporter ATP-binding protein [Limosilactobacillus rudii]